MVRGANAEHVWLDSKFEAFAKKSRDVVGFTDDFGDFGAVFLEAIEVVGWSGVSWRIDKGGDKGGFPTYPGAVAVIVATETLSVELCEHSGWISYPESFSANEQSPLDEKMITSL